MKTIIDNVYTRMGEAISMFAYSIQPELFNNKYLNHSGHFRKVERDHVLKSLNYCIPEGIFELQYKDNIFKLNLFRTDKSCISTDTGKSGAFIFRSIEIESENQEIINNFIADACLYFDQNVLRKNKLSNRINVYMYDDDEWIILSKNKPRDINTLYLKKNVKTEIISKIKYFLDFKTESWYDMRGIPYKYNLIFHGIPGTGKTSTIKCIASELNYNLAIINFDINMTDKSLIKSLKSLPENTLLVLEDIDVLFKARKENDEYKTNLSFSALLNCLDGHSTQNGLITVMTTNYLCNLDDALTRSCRVDTIIKFTYADKFQINKIFNMFFPEKDITEFYSLIKGYSFTIAQIQEYFVNNITKYSDNIDTDLNIVIENIDQLIKKAIENNEKNKEFIYT